MMPIEAISAISARHGSLGEKTLNLVHAASPAAAKLVDTIPYFVKVWRAAHALNKALARGELAYEEQAALNALLEEVTA